MSRRELVGVSALESYACVAALDFLVADFFLGDVAAGLVSAFFPPALSAAQRARCAAATFAPRRHSWCGASEPLPQTLPD